MQNKNPTFNLYVGPMFSGKTSMLLLSLEKHKHQGKKCIVFKPKIDDRYSATNVVSHGGAQASSVAVASGADVLKYLSDLDSQPQVVAVDEAFMIPGIADALIYLYRLGMTILVSTLEISAACKPFNEPERMMPWATEIHKMSAACVVCGSDAFYTYKKEDNDNEIEVGGVELYEPRCRHHHPYFIFTESSSLQGA